MSDNRTKLINWNKSFECGIKQLDEQHKALVDLVNEMFQNITGNEKQENDYFDKIYHKAADSIKEHFITEERILSATKYAGYAEHKKAHKLFTLSINNELRKHESGKKISLSYFTGYIKDWILSHIAVMDKQYFEYFKQIATSGKDVKIQ
ncbi:MAG: bacteriohemerythrin [Treponema sp.]|nr:bacteriohemerythrin [Treponema sp.]